MKNLLKICSFTLLISALSPLSHATIVQFQTPAGDFEVNLFDQGTPQTVDNFLRYVSEGHYEDAIFHRSVSGFVLQGGGFQHIDFQVTPIATFPSVTNEPEFSNVRGTIAMAKLGSQPDSATSQWFINLDDNSANLDITNEGFTVFGVVTGNGMGVIDNIASWPTFNFGSPLNEQPLRDYTAEDYQNQTLPLAEHQALIYNIVVLDASETTADTLSPAINITLIDPPSTGGSGSDGGGGGGTSFLFLAALFGLLTYRRYRA